LHIVAIAWLYVVILMAATESSWVGAVMTLVFYGLLPLAIVLFVFGTPERRRRAARREAEAAASGLPDQPVGKADGAHTKQDQTDLRDRG
jgi:cbb3-type cytochrome oxidase subunit 3